mgnify:CR=1 FL=1
MLVEPTTVSMPPRVFVAGERDGDDFAFARSLMAFSSARKIILDTLRPASLDASASQGDRDEHHGQAQSMTISPRPSKPGGDVGVVPPSGIRRETVTE